MASATPSGTFSCTIVLNGTAPTGTLSTPTSLPNVGYVMNCTVSSGYSNHVNGVFNAGSYNYFVYIDNGINADTTFTYTAGGAVKQTCAGQTLNCWEIVAESVPGDVGESGCTPIGTVHSFAGCGSSSDDLGPLTATSYFGVPVLAVDGPNGECTPTAESGFFSGPANGTQTYTFQLSFTGASSLIAADPEDGSLPTVTRDGETFSNDTVFQPTGADPAFSPVIANTIFITTQPLTGTDPNAVHFYCEYAGTWYDWGTPASGGSGPLPNPPACSGIGVTSQGVVDGTQTVNVTFTPSVNNGPFLLDPNNGGTATEPILGGGTMLWEPDVDWKLIEPDSDDDALILSVTQTADATTGPTLWCYDETTSAWVDEGTTASGSVYGDNVGASGSDSGCFDLSSHLATSGMDLYNPISWVTGLAKDTGYVIMWAVVPCSDKMTELANTFGITSNAPTGATPASQWLGAMAKSVTAFPFTEVANIQTVADGGGCSGSPLTDTDTLDGHSISACTILTSLNTLPSEATTDLSWLQAILSAIIYVFAALLLFHFIKRAVEQ